MGRDYRGGVRAPGPGGRPSGRSAPSGVAFVASEDRCGRRVTNGGRGRLARCDSCDALPVSAGTPRRFWIVEQLNTQMRTRAIRTMNDHHQPAHHARPPPVPDGAVIEIEHDGERHDGARAAGRRRVCSSWTPATARTPFVVRYDELGSFRVFEPELARPRCWPDRRADASPTVASRRSTRRDDCAAGEVRPPGTAILGGVHMENMQRDVTGWVGWIVFAAVIMVMMGVFGIIGGLIAIFDDSWGAERRPVRRVDGQHLGVDGTDHRGHRRCSPHSGSCKGKTWARVVAIVIVRPRGHRPLRDRPRLPDLVVDRHPPLHVRDLRPDRPRARATHRRLSCQPHRRVRCVGVDEQQHIGHHEGVGGPGALRRLLSQ